MKAVIQTSQLRRGDIILTTTKKLDSWMLRQAMGTDFSHAMIYLGGGQIIDATLLGVKSSSIQAALKEVSLALVLRRRNMSDELRGEVVKVAKSFEGRKYDVSGAFGSGAAKARGIVLTGGLMINPLGSVAVALASVFVVENARKASKDRSFFCSELVARSYHLIGKPLYDGVETSFVNPRDVRTSSKLLYMGHLQF